MELIGYKYNWKGMNYESKIGDLKTFKKNNPKIAINIWYIKEIEICPGYLSKIDANCENQIIV